MASILSKFAARPRLTVLSLGLLLLLSGNWSLPLLDRDEPRFAEAGREMLQRQDWIVPWFNGDYRFDKPPLIYWCETFFYQLFGESEFTARLAGVCFTVATALLLVEWGRRVNRARAGFFAALIYLTCLQVQIHGRLAVADMPMVFFVTLAIWSGWEFTRPDAGNRRFWWFVCFAALGLGFLAKGPIAWLPILGLIILRRRQPQAFLLRGWEIWAGVGIMLAITLAWGIPAVVKTQGAYLSIGLGHHVIYRSVGVMDGHGAVGWIGYAVSLPIYFLTFFLSFLPWSFRVPARLRAWWPVRHQDVLGNYLLWQAAIVFIVFSLVRTKLPHYTLPAFPCLAFWLALQMEEQPKFGQWFSRRVVGMSVAVLLVTWLGFSAIRPLFLSETIWSRLQSQVHPETRVACLNYTEGSLVWKFRGVATNYILLSPKPFEVTNFLAQPGPWIFVAPTNFSLPSLPTTQNVTALNITGYDVSRWYLTRQPLQLGSFTFPGWTLKPREWHLTAWLSPDSGR